MSGPSVLLHTDLEPWNQGPKFTQLIRGLFYLPTHSDHQVQLWTRIILPLWLVELLWPYLEASVGTGGGRSHCCLSGTHWSWVQLHSFCLALVSACRGSAWGHPDVAHSRAGHCICVLKEAISSSGVFVLLSFTLGAIFKFWKKYVCLV